MRAQTGARLLLVVVLAALAVSCNATDSQAEKKSRKGKLTHHKHLQKKAHTHAKANDFNLCAENCIEW